MLQVEQKSEEWPRRSLLGGAVVLNLFAAVAVLPCRADPGDALDTGGGGVAQRFVAHAEDALIHGRVTEATSYCDRALALYPSFINARFERGKIMLFSGQYDAALDDFSALIAAHPEYADGYVYRGITYLRQHKPEQAIQDFNKAMIPKVGIDSAVASDVFLYRSLAFELLGRADDSIADFSDALKQMYGFDFAWTVLGFGCYTASVVGLLDSAILICDESISRKSRNTLAYGGRGLANLKSGQFAKAIADYTQSLYYQDDNAFDLYGRGAAKHALGDRAGGDADIAAATSSEPHIAEIMTRLGVNKSGTAAK
jgi:tetratricopeptide (TPR) repeat protein